MQSFSHLKQMLVFFFIYFYFWNPSPFTIANAGIVVEEQQPDGATAMVR